jgi:peptidoglycan/LPS O-acetylase OafA/YrhL
MVVGWFMASGGPPWAPQSLLWDFIATPMHMQFLLGVATALAVMADLVPAPRCLLGFAVVGLACAAALENGGVIAYLGPASQALFGGFSALAIAGMASAERRSLMSIGAVPYLVGEASYAIYLVHYQAIALAISALAASGLLRTLPGWSLMLGLTAVGAGAGLGLHLLAERPLLRPRRLAAPAALPST